MSGLRQAVGGTLGGVIGSMVMAVPVFAARSSGLMGTPPPERIVEGLLDRAGVRLDAEAEDRLAVVAHLGFGATAGALYGVAAPRVRSMTTAVAMGLIYATGIYAVSYAGWVPALRLLPPPDRDDPSRQVAMLLAHWMYGTTLAIATQVASQPTGPAELESE